MKPIKRRELIAKLKRFGFEGPFPGGKHSYMKRGSLKLRIPNEHSTDIADDLLQKILKQAGIDKEEWDKV